MSEFVPISPRISVTPDLKERIEIGRKRPTEEMYRGKKGYRRFHVDVSGQKKAGEAPDGTYKWEYKFQPNDKGKMTREAQEVMEHIAPFSRADTERHARMEAQTPKVTLKDEHGSAQYIRAEQAESVANKNGWHSAHRIVGILATDVNGDFCPDCDRLLTWCDCG